MIVVSDTTPLNDLILIAPPPSCRPGHYPSDSPHQAPSLRS